ncbi:hypothetical protein E4V01_21900 [Methylorubrum sp. Q1]|uniref:hypothetical protein n=1 Tax=Methylorubrum sp. Q1 TaxID=2562453 RepID=UPI001076095F|nr:hypothetical protein [Methylorubrum sp. Q1]TFZ55579.1 hypothetical protein E4V01_21900 [Methylorubrum sp. Q1]
MSRDPYAFWDALLAGEPADLERNEVVCGRFWKRLQSGDVIGISIDPLDGAHGFETRVGKGTPFTLTTDRQMEDFCEGTLSWICRQPVSHEDYAAWWSTGQWSDGALIDRKPPKPSRRKPVAAPVEPKLDTPTEPTSQDTPAARASVPGEPSAAPGIYVRAYSCIDACPEAEAYYARAIIRRGSREGTSVGFYAESAEAAREKAQAWVQAERDREKRSAEGRAAGAAKRQQPRSTESVETGASL